MYKENKWGLEIVTWVEKPCTSDAFFPFLFPISDSKYIREPSGADSGRWKIKVEMPQNKPSYQKESLTLQLSKQLVHVIDKMAGPIPSPCHSCSPFPGLGNDHPSNKRPPIIKTGSHTHTQGSVSQRKVSGNHKVSS